MSAPLLKMALLLLALAAPLHTASAHPLAPALLELRESGEQRYDVRWQLSLLQPANAQPEPMLPAECEALTPRRTQLKSDQRAVEMHWQVQCSRSLVGLQLGVRGLDGSGINALVLVHHADGRTTQSLLDADRPWMEVTAAPSTWAVMVQYGGLGVTHLLFGPDHLAFVVGLFFLVGGIAHGVRPLLLMTAAFTVGHSITLALSVLGIVRLSSTVAEAGIALSIVWVGWRVLRHRGRQSHRPGSGQRAAVATFAFGLLHGLGFAGALRALGLPETAMIPALAAFNIGIEAGQLLVIGFLLLALRAVPRRLFHDTRQPVTVSAAYVVGSMGAFWTIDRLLLLLPTPLLG